MADSDLKISQLIPATTSGGSDLVPIVQGGINKRSSPNVLGIISSGTPTITLGGFQAGMPYSNQSGDAMWQTLLSPYQDPAFISFSISGQTIKEVGDKIAGSQTFLWTTSNSANVKPNSINIRDITGGGGNLFLVDIANNGSVVYDFDSFPGGGLELDVPGSYIFQIKGDNTNLIEFVENLNLLWMRRVFSGMNINETLTNAQVLALANSSLTETFPTQVSTAGGGFFWYLVPISFVQPTIFKNHATGIEIAMEDPIVMEITNSFEIDYFCKGYRSTSPLILGVTVDIS